jgi:hypothetical protein
VKRSPAAKATSLAKEVAALAAAVKATIPIEAPFIRTSRSA